MGQASNPTRGTGMAEWGWQQQSIWSRTADALKARLTRWRRVAFGLTAAGAVLATAATQVTQISQPGGRVLAALAAVCVGLLPLVLKQVGADRLAAWTRARAVSEAIKAEVYAFLAGAGGYRHGDPAATLRERVEAVVADADDLSAYTLGVAPAARQLPAVHDVDSYLTLRVIDQIEGYYRPAGLRIRGQLRLLRGVAAGLAVVGVLLAAAAATYGSAGAATWVPTITTLTAAVSTHAAANRYDYLLLEYTRTAAQLDRLRQMWVATPEVWADPAAQDRLVTDCEQVISIQNDAWMAKHSSLVSEDG